MDFMEKITQFNGHAQWHFSTTCFLLCKVVVQMILGDGVAQHSHMRQPLEKLVEEAIWWKRHSGGGGARAMSFLLVGSQPWPAAAFVPFIVLLNLFGHQQAARTSSMSWLVLVHPVLTTHCPPCMQVGLASFEVSRYRCKFRILKIMTDWLWLIGWTSLSVIRIYSVPSVRALFRLKPWTCRPINTDSEKLEFRV